MTMNPSRTASPEASRPVQDLTSWKGYTVLGRLPQDTVRAARRRINLWLASGMTDLSRATLSGERLVQDYDWNSYGDDELRGSDEIHACFRPLEAQIRRLIGPDTAFRYTPRETQLALRFPMSVGVPHLDGMLFPQPNPLQPPAGILIVYLTDVGPDDAPFTIWPDAMATVQEIARRSLETDRPARARDELWSVIRELRFEDAEQVTAPAGTAVLAHPSLPHCNGPATGPDIRYAAIRRYYPQSWFDGEPLRPQSWSEALSALVSRLHPDMEAPGIQGPNTEGPNPATRTGPDAGQPVGGPVDVA